MSIKAPKHRSLIISALLAVFAGISCSDDLLDPGRQSNGEITVRLTVEPDSMGPGDWAEIHLIATPEDP